MIGIFTFVRVKAYKPGIYAVIWMVRREGKKTSCALNGEWSKYLTIKILSEVIIFAFLCQGLSHRKS